MKGTEGLWDWLGILFGRGKRHPNKSKNGCSFFPCLILTVAAAPLVASATYLASVMT